MLDGRLIKWCSITKKILLFGACLLCTPAFSNSLFFSPEGCKKTITTKYMQLNTPKKSDKSFAAKDQKKEGTIEEPSLDLKVLLSSLTAIEQTLTPKPEETTRDTPDVNDHTLLRFKNQEGVLIKMTHFGTDTSEINLTCGSLFDTRHYLAFYQPMRVFICSTHKNSSRQYASHFIAHELSSASFISEPRLITESVPWNSIPEPLREEYNLTCQSSFLLAFTTTGTLAIVTSQKPDIQPTRYIAKCCLSETPAIAHLEPLLSEDEYNMISQWNDYFRAHLLVKKEMPEASAEDFANIWMSAPFTGTELLKNNVAIRTLWQSWYLSAFNADPRHSTGVAVRLENSYLRSFCQQLSNLDIAPGFMSTPDNEDWWNIYVDAYSTFEELSTEPQLRDNMLPTLKNIVQEITKTSPKHYNLKSLTTADGYKQLSVKSKSSLKNILNLSKTPLKKPATHVVRAFCTRSLTDMINAAGNDLFTEDEQRNIRRMCFHSNKATKRVTPTLIQKHHRKRQAQAPSISFKIYEGPLLKQPR